MLEIKSVSKSYGSNKALSEFSACFERGVYALLGPNGSGKSTLMNIMTDNLKADSGEILFNGENIRKMGKTFRAGLGFMPQYPGMYTNFTVEQFLYYMAELKDIGAGLKSSEKRKLISERVASVLCEVELDDVPNRRIGALSGGMKQRLALAQAVLGDPEILILDEPTAGLDPKQRISIRNYISKIAFNKTVIIATHVVSDIEYIARDIFVLKKGKIIDRGAPDALVSKLEGKVWHLSADTSCVSELQSKFRVTNISRDEESGKACLRILSDTSPHIDARCVPPTLEDYYLYTVEE